jgi:hypothetical protein
VSRACPCGQHVRNAPAVIKCEPLVRICQCLPNASVQQALALSQPTALSMPRPPRMRYACSSGPRQQRGPIATERVSGPRRGTACRLGARGMIASMVRPDRIMLSNQNDSRCIRLAGESPVAVSAGAPRSRSQATSESLASERDVESPQVAVWLLGGKQVGGPNMK